MYGVNEIKCALERQLANYVGIGYDLSDVCFCANEDNVVVFDGEDVQYPYCVLHPTEDDSIKMDFYWYDMDGNVDSISRDWCFTGYDIDEMAEDIFTLLFF